MSHLLYQNPSVSLYVGDAVGVLRSLPDASVRCVVTSPPFWQLRNYGTASWIGGKVNCRHESWQSATDDIDTTAAEWHLVRDPERQAGYRIVVCGRRGAVWEDRQYGLEPTVNAYVRRLRTLFNQIRRVLVDKGTVWLNLGDRYNIRARGGQRMHDRVPSKKLLVIPWLVAFALQHDGWVLRNDRVVQARPSRQ